MKKKSTRFLCLLLSAVFILTGLLSGAAFLFDPQNVYRWNTVGERTFPPIYTAAGSIAHYDYDTLILGSSMVQNWDAETLAETMRCKPLKVTVGAMTPSEMLFLYNAALDAGKAKTYIVNIDLHRVAAASSVEPDAGRFPAYQFRPHGLKQFQYLLGYTTWVEFMPTDILCSLEPIVPLPASLRRKIKESTDVNTMCRWDESQTMTAKKWQQVKEEGDKNFNEGDNSVYVDTYKENMDALLQGLREALPKDAHLKLYLPPYSALYWHEKSERQTDILLQLRSQLAETAANDPQITLIDLQWIDETKDHALYVDANHAGETLRKFTERALAREEYSVTDTRQMEENNSRIRQNATEV